MTLDSIPRENIRNAPLAPGAWVGDYKIMKLIGVGGMGVVYGAIHPIIGKRAAIKVLDARYCVDHEGLTRFIHEAQVVNRIGHANIVDIFAIGELEDGRSYLAMEWLSGETLADRLDRGPLPLQQAIDILIALARALEAAHAASVIHRDLKPENVMLVPEDDDAVRVKLLDFGIAKLGTRSTPGSRTETGMTIGTPEFMSPEQAKGMPVDGSCDTYALGVIAYAMFTGKTPFQHEGSPVEVMHAHIYKRPRAPGELSANVSGELDALIIEMLAKHPAERPSLREIRTRLREIGSRETAAPVRAVTEPDRRRALGVWLRSRRSLIGAGALLGLVAAIAVVVTRPSSEPRPIPPAAAIAPTATIEPAATIEPVARIHRGSAIREIPRAKPRLVAKPKPKPKAQPKPKPKDVDGVVDPFRHKR